METPIPPPISPTPNPSRTIPIILAIVILLLSVALAYLALQNQKLTQAINEFNQSTSIQAQENSPSPASNNDTPNPTPSSSSWKRVNFGSLFSYEHPAGWYVAELWGSNYSSGTMIVIDQKPISTAPRGGPLGIFEVVVQNGLSDPNQTLEEEKTKFKNQLTNLEEETIPHESGLITHYKGQLTPGMFGGMTMEGYFLTFEVNPNDPMNQQVIKASMLYDGSSEYSDLLRKITLSIKTIDL